GVGREGKVGEVWGLAAVAFSGLAERTREIESEVATAFESAGEVLASEQLKMPLMAAGMALSAGDWNAAAREQGSAADLLTETWRRLKEAQTDAARKQLAGLAERAETDIAAQAELEKLKAGGGDDLLDEPEGRRLEEI